MLNLMSLNINTPPTSAPVSRRFALVGGLAVAIIIIFFVLPGLLLASDTNTNAPAATARASEKKPVRQLSGAELYAIHCNRCHQERYPEEFNQDRWKSLIFHMQVRANLPAEQARIVLKYLQDQSGN